MPRRCLCDHCSDYCEAEEGSEYCRECSLRLSPHDTCH